MPHGLTKATACLNSIEAWRDWGRCVNFAEKHGCLDIAEELWPKAGAGSRKVDNAIGQLRKRMAERGVELPKAYELRE